MSMLAPWPLATLLRLTQPSWRQMDLKSFSAACHSGWRERASFPRAHTGCHLTNRRKITFTRQNGKVLGFVRQKWNNLFFIKYHEKSINSCQKRKYKHSHVESIYSEGAIWQSLQDHALRVLPQSSEFGASHTCRGLKELLCSNYIC